MNFKIENGKCFVSPLMSTIYMCCDFLIITNDLLFIWTWSYYHHAISFSETCSCCCYCCCCCCCCCCCGCIAMDHWRWCHSQLSAEIKYGLTADILPTRSECVVVDQLDLSYTSGERALADLSNCEVKIFPFTRLLTKDIKFGYYSCTVQCLRRCAPKGCAAPALSC